MTTLGNVAVLVVISFLLVILIYSSVAEVDIFAKQKITMECFKTGPSSSFPGAAYAETCCQSVPGKGTYCVTCGYDANGNGVGTCVGSTYKTGTSPNPPSAGTLLPGNSTGGVTNGQTGPPRLGTVLPTQNNTNTGTLPAQTITKEHNPSSPNLLSSGANPSNNQQPSGHHHGGSGTSSSNPSSSSGSSSGTSSSSSGSSGSSSNSGSGSNTGSGSNHH